MSTRYRMTASCPTCGRVAPYRPAGSQFRPHKTPDETAMCPNGLDQAESEQYRAAVQEARTKVQQIKDPETQLPPHLR